MIIHQGCILIHQLIIINIIYNYNNYNYNNKSLIHQGFTQVENAHTKIDWLIKVKLCLLHVNCNEVFIEDRTTIKVCLGC